MDLKKDVFDQIDSKDDDYHQIDRFSVKRLLDHSLERTNVDY